jgi:hypothetical protein
VSYVEQLIESPLVACTWEQATADGWEQQIVRDRVRIGERPKPILVAKESELSHEGRERQEIISD